MEEKKQTYSRNKIILGVVLIIVGIKFLLPTLNIDILGEWKTAVFSWQMILLILCVVGVFKKKYMESFLLLGIALFFILPRIPIFSIPYSFIHMWWPLLLIYCGSIIIIFNTPFKRKIFLDTQSDDSQSNSMNINEGEIDCRIAFRNESFRFTETFFRGGTLQVVFAGITLDLRETFLQEGETHIYCKSLFGGITILTPESWNIEIDNQCLFGDFIDKRTQTTIVTTEKKLTIHTKILFGGGELH